MSLILAPKSMKEIEENSSKLTDEKLGENTLKFMKKRSIQLRDEIHEQRSAILIESNIYKV
jgi:uncharacterized protein YdcH (DUF465 family)